MHITTVLSLAFTILTTSASPAPTFSPPSPLSLSLPTLEPTGLPTLPVSLALPTAKSAEIPTLPVSLALPTVKSAEIPTLPLSLALPTVNSNEIPTQPLSLPLALSTGVEKLEKAAKATTTSVPAPQTVDWKCPASIPGAAGNNKVVYKPACCDYISGCLGNDFTALECFEAIPVEEAADEGAGVYTCDLVDGHEVTRLGNRGCCSQVGDSTKYECVRVVYT